MLPLPTARESQVLEEGENMKRQLGNIAAAFLVFAVATGAAMQAQTPTFTYFTASRAVVREQDCLWTLRATSTGTTLGSDSGAGAVLKLIP